MYNVADRSMAINDSESQAAHMSNIIADKDM